MKQVSTIITKKLRMDKVNVILILFKEKDIQLLREVCIGLKYQSEPCYITVMYDKQTPKKNKKLVDSFEFDEYIYSPVELTNNVALKHAWVYDRSKFRYVAFQQGDDQPYLSRIKIQLNVLKTSTKKLGICFGGFSYMRNKSLDNYKRDHFKFIKKHMFNVGYPSFWLCDKKYLPIMPKVEGFISPNEWEWDLFLIIEICKLVESIIIQELTGIYNQHSLNYTNLYISDNNKTEALQKLIDFFEIERSKLKNIYYFDVNHRRSDNE